MLQDVSMKSLKTKVAQNTAMLEQIARVWAGSSSETFTLPLLLDRIHSPFIARSVWQRLDADERLCLFHLLTHSSRGKGVPVEALRRKTKLPLPTFMSAVGRLAE